MIKLITGPMYSGKSSKLIELILKDYSQDFYHYLFVRPEVDTRGFITRDKSMEKRLSNSRHNIEYLHVNSFTDLLDIDVGQYRSIFIDELHMIGSDDEQEFLKKVLSSGTPLIAAGLNGSSEQEAFEPVSILFPFIDDLELLKATCYHDENDGTHEKASYTKWVSRKNKKNLIEVGDSEYAASCAQCLNIH